MKIIVLIFLLISPLGAVQAQETPRTDTPAKLVPPPGPLIQKRAPDMSCWTVTVKTSPNVPPGDTSPPEASPDDTAKTIATQSVITKTGNITRVDYTNEQKVTLTIWVFGNNQVVAWPDGKSVGFVAQPRTIMDFNPLYMDFSSTDFQGFTWISAANYTGVKTVAGRQCFEFKDTMMISGASVPVIADTDIKTRLPVQLQNENGLTTYDFQATPADMQELPANVEKLIADQQHKEKSLARLPAPAY